jgi:hypothetical protein
MGRHLPDEIHRGPLPRQAAAQVDARGAQIVGQQNDRQPLAVLREQVLP